MSKNKSKKYDTAPATDAVETNDVLPVSIQADELLAGDTPDEVKPKKERAPRIVRPRFRLIDDATSTELVFSHYPVPTRRAPTGNILVDMIETPFTVTKSQSRDKTEDRAYSYFTLPNGATGYVAKELEVGTTLSLKELPPAEPFGRAPKAAEVVPEGEAAAA